MLIFFFQRECLDMTEIVFTGMLNLNSNKQIYLIGHDTFVLAKSGQGHCFCFKY